MSVHPQEPFMQVQVLQSWAFVSPFWHSGQAILVQAQVPASVQLHVLQPSPAARVAPGSHSAVPPSWEHAISVQAHAPSLHVQVLQPSFASAR